MKHFQINKEEICMIDLDTMDHKALEEEQEEVKVAITLIHLQDSMDLI